MQGNHNRLEVRQKLKQAQKLVFQRKLPGMALNCAPSPFLNSWARPSIPIYVYDIT